MVFYGCSKMGAFRERQEGQTFSTLFDEWMPGYYINGLRTVSGVDGVEVGGNVDGWHFFARYNKGDSIADSYSLGSFDGWNGHSPVTVSYGATVGDALTTLSDGRFSEEAAEPTWAVSSVWRNIKE